MTIAARAVALATVVSCMVLPSWARSAGWFVNDAMAAVIGLVGVLILRDGDASSLGFRLCPARGWRFWLRIALAMGLVVGVLLGLVAAALLLLRRELPIYRADPAELLPRFLLMCVSAPVVEEVVYRSLLISAVRPTVGDRGAIVVSGLTFAVLHWIYGNPSPENQIGGFLLACAYVRSGTILVPLALHAGGNLIVLISQVAAWYWLPASTLPA